LAVGVACYAFWNQAESATDAPAFATELEAASAEVETTAGVDRGLRTAVTFPVMAAAHQQELTPAPTHIAAQDTRGPSSAFGSVLIKQVEPEYPSDAKAAEVEGLVIITYSVDSAGRPSNLTVTKSIPMLDAAAMAALRQWRYTPPLNGATPQLDRFNAEFVLDGWSAGTP
jgi:TonB family protein